MPASPRNYVLAQHCHALAILGVARALLLYALTAVLAFARCSAGQEEFKPHTWLPPFGLDRVGVVATGFDPEKLPNFEADAVARTKTIVNPVDLGTILVPGGWLLLTPRAAVEVEVAAITRRSAPLRGRAVVWYSSAPEQKCSTALTFVEGQVIRAVIALTHANPPSQRDMLHVAIESDDGEGLWKKEIPVIMVAAATQWPRFGATRYKLRYDAPISVREADGRYSQMDYEQAWDEKLDDVIIPPVVCPRANGQWLPQ